ncbi:MAG: DNA/RNA nuclease SfsA [Myxococcota bacterium]|nr:DNA/RNA nuclease SfsA [Myxococcota bacterium]
MGAARRTTPPVARLPLRADLRGRLLRRYKRFFADVETTEGAKLTVHCPNPGSMRGLLAPGAPVRCSTSDDPRRRLRHTLEMIRIGRTWVGLHPGRANAHAGAALDAGLVPPVAGHARRRAEVRVAGGSRLDFVLEGHPRDPRPLHLEVKSVTMAEGRVARFPDSVTARGRRHMEALAELAAAGGRAALLFVVQRADCVRVEPADDVDPAYGEALRAARDAGVTLHAVRARVSPRGIRVEDVLPVVT